MVSCFSRKFCNALMLCMILVCTSVHLTRATYILNVELHSYASTTHIQSDGFCCHSNCTQHCNNRFKFCLRPTGVSTDEEADVCLDSTEQYVTNSTSNDLMEFEIGRNLDVNVPNPLVFTGDRWPGTVDFFVRVNDVNPNGGQEDLVARFVVPVDLNPAGENSEPVVVYQSISNQGQFIRLAFELNCEENFYGEDCMQFCIGRNDEGGHYECDINGDKVCLEGFQGESTNCTQFCIGRNDEGGHYECDINGDKVCLEGFQGESTNCTQCVLASECSPVSAYCTSTDRCVCRDDFTGPNCAFLKYLCGVFSPCQNGGSCTNTESEDGSTDYMCTCLAGYKGRNCTEGDICISSPCLSGGICMETAEGYKCQCPSGFEGTNCELQSMPIFMGPFIGAAIAIGVLLIIIVILAAVLVYTFWQMRCRTAQGKQQDNAGDRRCTTTHSQTDSTGYQVNVTNANFYEFDDGEEGDTLPKLEGDSDPRKNSETFDNPIYDQPTPPRTKKESGASSERKLTSLSSSRSLSISPSQDYPVPLTARSMENSFRNDSVQHKYEDIVLGGSEECLNISFKASNTPRGSLQQITRSDTEVVDKLTVINESYGPLPCLSLSSSGYTSLQDSASETRKLASRPVNPEVVSTEVLGKQHVPNGHDPRGSADGFHGNSLRLEIESCEQ